jgi:hypothetical protein
VTLMRPLDGVPGGCREGPRDTLKGTKGGSEGSESLPCSLTILSDPATGSDTASALLYRTLRLCLEIVCGGLW